VLFVYKHKRLSTVLTHARTPRSSRNNSAAQTRTCDNAALKHSRASPPAINASSLKVINKEVRLALDWALYRMGRSELLYRIVDELDSGRQDQAIGYLSELESPEVLYPFLKRTTNAPRINAGLLKALARIGDAQTLELVKPFRDSHQPYVAEAAEIAHDEIEKRLGEPAPSVRARPRTVEKPADKP
jgi:hypothetical protein